MRFGRVPKREKAKIMAEMQKQNAKSQASSLCAEMDDQESLLALIVKAHEETCEYTKPKITGILEQWKATNHLPELSSTVVSPLETRTWLHEPFRKDFWSVFCYMQILHTSICFGRALWTWLIAKSRVGNAKRCLDRNLWSFWLRLTVVFYE